MSSAPHMTYWPIGGRGALIRLICAAGGLELTEAQALPEGEENADYLTPSGLPVLSHGDLRMSQSGAIETYLAGIAPRFADLTAKQRAVDGMYAGIKEEILANCAKAIFTTRKSDPEQAKKDVVALLDKWFTILEAKVPEDGFILGLGFPTVADLVFVNITESYMPFGAATKDGVYDFSKWKKISSLCDRVKSTPEVAAFLANDKNMKAAIMGICFQTTSAYVVKPDTSQ